jgi:hypothetical protein
VDRQTQELREDVEDLEMGILNPRMRTRLNRIYGSVGAFFVFALWLVLTA